MVSLRTVGSLDAVARASGRSSYVRTSRGAHCRTAGAVVVQSLRPSMAYGSRTKGIGPVEAPRRHSASPSFTSR